MKKTFLPYICSVIITYTIIACKSEPKLPTIQYDNVKSKLTIIQNDKSAKDTLLIKIDNILKREIVVKDTTLYSIDEMLNNDDSYKAAYHLFKK